MALFLNAGGMFTPRLIERIPERIEKHPRAFV